MSEQCQLPVQPCVNEQDLIQAQNPWVVQDFGFSVLLPFLVLGMCKAGSTAQAFSGERN